MPLRCYVFDGVAIGAHLVLSVKFCEVLKYCTLSQTFWSPCAFEVNKTYWMELAENVKKILDTALAELFLGQIKEWKSGYR